jgi:hypothetical protein
MITATNMSGTMIAWMRSPPCSRRGGWACSADAVMLVGPVLMLPAMAAAMPWRCDEHTNHHGAAAA